MHSAALAGSMRRIHNFAPVAKISRCASIAALQLGAADLLTAGSATSSHASTSCTYAQIKGAGCTLTSGTQTAITDSAGTRNVFVTPDLGRGWQNDDALTLNSSGGGVWSLIFNFASQESVRSASLAAQLLLTNTDPTKVFDVASIARTGTPGIGGLVAGSQAVFSDGPTISTANILNLLGPTSAPFAKDVTATTINLTFVAVTGTLNTTTLQISQRNAPVPGPLPILGAASAFAWSRRIRRRIHTIA
ncbi:MULTISPECIES: hypothetical protein [unclassified Cyanobium]|uniref:hypothetical protein n=1 Tax=unclassified Cyanobium TaxID=2627006 RepID=UPI0020CBF89F|nr:MULTISPECIES: hypothetical protein [unclassified Cyanobium]MCP9861304.1 hypothetical protein [Cyanobium sp. Cruz-8H5]MCP9868562.1 hypothetical protein [Cyanobium sp. Cruz-8D1]